MNLPNKCLRLLSVTLRGGRMTKLGRVVVSCGPCLAVAVMAGVISSSQAQAQAYEWDGASGPNNGVIDGGSGDWDSSSSNWTFNGGATNGTWTDGLDAVFGGTAGTVTLVGPQFVDTLSFTSSGYELTSGFLFLEGNEISVQEGSATIGSEFEAFFGLTKTGSGELILSGFGFVFDNVAVSQGQLTLASPNALVPVGSQNLFVENTGGTPVLDLGGYTVSVDTLAVNGLDGTEVKNGTVNVDVLTTVDNGQISAILTGSGGLIKQGTGEATLTQQNTFTGAVSVNEGTLILSETGGINNASSVTIGSAGTLSVSGNENSIGGTTVIDNSGSFVLAGGDEAVGGVTGTGSIDLGANSLTFTSATPQIIEGVISGTGNLIKQGGGYLRLAGDNTATGTFVSHRGTASISGTWAGDVENYGTLLLDDPSSGDATYAFITTVEGTLSNHGTIRNNQFATSALLTGMTNFVSNGDFLTDGDIVVETENLTYQNGHRVLGGGEVTFDVSDTIIEERTTGPDWSGTGFTENFMTNAAGVFNANGNFATTGSFTHNSSADLIVAGFSSIKSDTFTNNGVVEILSFGDLEVVSGVTNNAGATIEIQHVGTLDAGMGVIDNAGEIILQGSGSLIFAGTLNNTGSIEARGAIASDIINQGNGVFEATNSLGGISSFTNTDSATFDITAGATSVSSFANTSDASGGTTIGSNATMDVILNAENGLADGSVNSIFQNNGTLSVHGTLTNHEGAELFSSSADSVIYAGEIINNGVMEVQGVVGKGTGIGTSIINSGDSAVFTVVGDTSGDGSTLGDFLNEDEAQLVISNGTLELTTLNNNSYGGDDGFAEPGVYINLGAELSVRTVNNAGILISEGTLTAVNINNTDPAAVVLNAGTINGDINNAGGLASGAPFATGGIINGNLTNTGTAIIGGELNGAITNGGRLEILAPLTGVTSVNNSGIGELVLSSADFSTGSLTNSSTGSVALEGGVYVDASSTLTATSIANSGSFNNLGTVTTPLLDNMAGGELFNGGTFDGDIGNREGAMVVNAGEIIGSVTNEGSFGSSGVLNGSLFTFGTAELTGVITGGIFNTGSLEVSGDLSGSGSLTNDIGGTTLVSGGTLETEVVYNYSVGTGTSQTTAGLQIAEGAVVDTRTVYNYGMMNNAGEVIAASPILNLSGATLISSGTITGGLNNLGTLELSGTLDGDLLNTDQATAEGVITGDITNSGTLNVVGDLTGAERYETEVEFFVGRASEVSAAPVVSSILNVTGGTFEVAAVNNTSSGSGTGLTSAGIQITETGTLTTDTLTNTGTVFNAGTLNAGAATNAEGATLISTGTLTGEITNAGTLEIGGEMTGMITNSGEATISGALTGIDGVGAVENTGTLTNTGSIDVEVSNSGDLTNDGAITNRTVTAVDSTLTNNGVIGGYLGVLGDLENTGEITAFLENLGDISNSGTLSGFVSNEGTVLSSGIIAGDITNAGDLDNSGEITGGLTNEGTVLSSGIIAGDITNTGFLDNLGDITGSLTNEGTDLSSGIFLNAGTITGAVDNSGAALNEGTVVGSVANSGTFENNGDITGDLTNTGDLFLGGTLTGALDNSGAGQVATVGDVSGITDLTNTSTGAILVSAGDTLEAETITLADGSGGLLLAEGATLAGLGNTLNNGASIEVASGGTLMDAGAINNLATGTMSFAGDTTLFADSDASGDEGITNANLIYVNGGTLTASFGGAGIFSNSGQISLLSGGTLAVAGDLANTGWVDMQNDSVGESLIIDGDYTGGGFIALDVDLHEATADTLQISGDVSGAPTTLLVADVASGEATGANISLVNVDGETSEGDFVLDGGALVAGAYTYDLVLNGSAWTLGEEVNSTGETYEAFADSLATFSVLGTHSQRINARQWLSNGPDGKGAWFAVSGDFASATPTSTSGTRFETETNTYNLRVGYDVLGFSDDYGDWVFGLTGLYGTATTDTTSDLGAGSIDSTGYGIGASATWYGNNGVYLDVQGQMAWIGSDLASSAGGSLIEDYQTTATSLSVEAGARIALNAQSAIVPQAQLTYAHLDGGSLTDNAGNDVSFASNESVTARIGASYEFALANSAARTEGDKIYVIGNLLHTTGNTSEIDVAGDLLTQNSGGSWLEVGAGGSIGWNEGKTIFFETSYKKAIDADSAGRESFGITAGLQMEW
ncbi:autotransporter outer membrane beta-barrel domain-containing protein [Alphaproteobacteria bacterium KMM 3653]|uniref:Autotransporter outer membrane beta-barrel domain-containing protein n=1 Tax=Harenicola maris TaxID=2841044 RepID=A0AAP2CQP1_9RHOB|nr:autotransporter outer membrane beta-barrel domain-containing protein [Harenicola maris]